MSASVSTILADPPWRFRNRTGKISPSHSRLRRYETLSLDEIANLRSWIGHDDIQLSTDAHLYLWVPNALLLQGMFVMHRWGFTYKTQIIWLKQRKGGGPDRRCCGFYFRNCTESLLFGVRGRLRTKPPFNMPNVIASVKREHSRKPDEQYALIERCSPGPYLELFARHRRGGWIQRGDQIEGSDHE